MRDVIEHRLARLRIKAAELRDVFGDDARARALEWAASEIEAGLTESAAQLLSLADAAALSGYTVDHLARLIRRGRLPNSGRRGAPRVRLADLPIRFGNTGRSQKHIVRSNDDAPSAPKRYDARTDARSLVHRRLGVSDGRSDST